MDDKVRKFAQNYGYDSIRKSIKWGGYNVYEPFYYGDAECTDFSLFILVKNGVIRLTTRQESKELCGIIKHC